MQTSSPDKDPSDSKTGKSNSLFPVTPWSILLQCDKNDPSSPAFTALEELCNTYWKPLYLYTLSRGIKSHEAEDYVQGFLSHFISTRALTKINSSKGKLRYYLLASLRNHIAGHHRALNTIQRGGQNSHHAFDELSPEDENASLLSHESSHEKEFNKQWAEQNISVSMKQIEQDYILEGKETLFKALSPLVLGESKKTYNELSLELNISTSNLKISLHRMRKRFSQALRTTIAQTVDSPEDIENELRELIEAMGH